MQRIRPNRHPSNRNIILIGGGAPLADLLRQIETRPRDAQDVNILGLFADPKNIPLHMASHIKLLGGLSNLPTYLRHQHVDAVIVTFPRERTEDILWAIQQLERFPTSIKIILDSPAVCHGVRSFGEVHAERGEDVIGRLFSRDTPHHHDWKLRAKRVADLTFASIALVLLAPIMIGVMIAIKAESPGPVLFKQQRFGYKNMVFYIWKFRTMYVDVGDPTGGACTTRNDPSITRIGRWLRRTSIDELPQLFNVIRGEMSLVGPRAHPIAMRVAGKPYGVVAENYPERHQVWPGITGLAQINGFRGAVDSVEKARRRLEYDLHYIANWSLMLDFRILVRTAIIVLRDKNAF